MKVLLDNDGVIANSHQPLVDHYKKLGYNVTRKDIDVYNFGTFKEKIGQPTKDILDVFYNIWEKEPETIPVMDESVKDTINWILKTYDSAIVTANNIKHVKPWLDMQGINSKYLIENWDDKGKLTEYGIFVEDNPLLIVPEDKALFVRDNPWNQEAKADERFYETKELIRHLANYKALTTKR